VPFPAIIVAAALGLAARARPRDRPAHPPVPPLAGTLRTVALWGAIWLVPLAPSGGARRRHPATQIGAFFSQLAVVTFGGAYAVLAWMTQTVVQDFGWLTPPQMIDGARSGRDHAGAADPGDASSWVSLPPIREGGLALGVAGRR
jgi:chromate transporter